MTHSVQQRLARREVERALDRFFYRRLLPVVLVTQVLVGLLVGLVRGDLGRSRVGVLLDLLVVCAGVAVVLPVLVWLVGG